MAIGAVAQPRLTADTIDEVLAAMTLQEKALELSKRFADELFVSVEFFLQYYDIAKREFDACYNCISYIADLSDHYGDKAFAKEIRERFNAMLDIKE